MKANVFTSPAALLVYGAAVYAILFDRSLWYLPLVFIFLTVTWRGILKFFRLDP